MWGIYALLAPQPIVLSPTSTLLPLENVRQSPDTAFPSYGSKYWFVHAGGGLTLVPVFGDTNRRSNFLAGLDYVKPARYLRWGRRRGSLMQELYFEHSGSKGGSGLNGAQPAQYDAAGYLVGARYDWVLGHYGAYGDIGWGLQYNSQRTIDLPSRLNSTPFVDLGFWIPNGSHPLLLGLRYLHISNGGTVGANAGQNQLFLDLGMKL